jgi:hypothetical protein
MRTLSGLLQRRIFLLSFGRGGGKEIRDSWWQMKVGSLYGMCKVLR